MELLNTLLNNWEIVGLVLSNILALFVKLPSRKNPNEIG